LTDGLVVINDQVKICEKSPMTVDPIRTQIRTLSVSVDSHLYVVAKEQLKR